MTGTAPANAEELRYWLALHRVPRVGAKRFAAMIGHFGSPRSCLEAGRQAWLAAGLKENIVNALASPDWAGVERDLQWAERPGNACLTWDDPGYPPLLREAPDAPPVLFVAGDPGALTRRQIAIVGSRNPSPSGSRIAYEFAASLVTQGFAVTSGLALGIDAAGHRGALKGGGITVAVTGTGPDLVYPAEHQALAEAIIDQGGAMISELLPGTGPHASNFPRRNRIISGLALGTLVVEAAARSGSLITARLALEQNREVFAIPGSIYSPLSQGCNSLIKEGAKLVQSVSDILDEFEFNPVSPVSSARGPAPTGVDPEALAFLKFVAYDPTSVDTLVANTGKSPEFIASMLLLLELQGYVAAAPGGCYVRVK